MYSEYMNIIFKERMILDEGGDMIKIVGGDKSYVTFEEFKRL